MNEYVIESFIDRCDELVIANEGPSRDGYKLLKTDKFKKAKQLVKDAKKLRKSNPDKAISYYKEAITIAKELKQECFAIKDNRNALIRFFTCLSPLLLFIPNSVSGGGNTIVTYTDELSERSNNDVLKAVQERLNLFIHQCNGAIYDCKDRIEKYNKTMNA